MTGMMRPFGEAHVIAPSGTPPRARAGAREYHKLTIWSNNARVLACPSGVCAACHLLRARSVTVSFGYTRGKRLFVSRFASL